MIDSLTIQNFRCYEQVTLHHLKNINLVVGGNASGKTAFLEALYFTCGSPALAFKMNLWRGSGGQFQFTEHSESRAAIWRDLFYKFEQHRIVKIAFRGTSDIARSVEIVSHGQGSQYVSSKKGKTSISDIPPISFEYSQNGQYLTAVRPEFSGDGMTFPNTPEPLAGAFFPSALPIDPRETATHFSNLSKKGKVATVVDALRQLFPEIRGLSLEMNHNLPMVYAEVEGVPEKVPLGLMSTGVTKLLAYLVSIADQHGGIVMIDEIENGLYYKKMGDIWRVLHSLCVDHDVQLFASTHSEECLEALQAVMLDHTTDFSLLRTERTDGECTIRHFDGKTLKHAIEQHAEVR